MLPESLLPLAGLLRGLTGCNFPIERRSCWVERALANAASIGSDKGQHTFPHGLWRQKTEGFSCFPFEVRPTWADCSLQTQG